MAGNASGLAVLNASDEWGSYIMLHLVPSTSIEQDFAARGYQEHATLDDIAKTYHGLWTWL